MTGYNNLKNKIIVFSQKNTFGEKLVDSISFSGLTKIPELHTPLFFENILGSEFLKKTKGKEYIENIREIISCNSDLNGFVTIISKSFFNIPREKLKKEKSESLNGWLEIFGENAKFVFLDLKNPIYRIVLKKIENAESVPDILRKKELERTLLDIYETYIRKESYHWSTNNFENKQIFKLYLEDLLENENEWLNLEKYLCLNLAQKKIDIDMEKHHKLYRIAEDNVDVLG